MGGSIGFILLMNYLMPEVKKPKEGIPHNYWIPTEEDIQFQDSMWSIINKTQEEVDTIKKSMEHIMIGLSNHGQLPRTVAMTFMFICMLTTETVGSLRTSFGFTMST